jgi:hypothetical protein
MSDVPYVSEIVLLTVNGINLFCSAAANDKDMNLHHGTDKVADPCFRWESC